MWATIKQHVFTWKVLFWTVLTGIVLGLLAIAAFFIWMASLARTVPSVEKLAEYNPPVTSRVHAGDGTLIYEFADEHRVFIPYEAIPEHVIHAFVSAEDKNFFSHGGIDYLGMTRGVVNSVRNKLTGGGGLQGELGASSGGAQPDVEPVRTRFVLDREEGVDSLEAGWRELQNGSIEQGPHLARGLADRRG